MPATQRGQAYRIAPHKWGLRYYDEHGVRRRVSPFPTRSAALAYYRDVIEPQLRGEPAPMPDLTLAEFVPVYLERHAANVRSRTIRTLTERLAHATTANEFGDIPLRELERMAAEIAGWHARQPERIRYGRMSALRQCLSAAVRWGYIDDNPAKLAGPNRQPSPREIRAYTRSEIDAIALELAPAYAPLPVFVSATGLRPEEWSAIERRDIDRRAGVLHVRRTVSDGEVVELGKTSRSRREVPLSPRAIDALDALPAQLHIPRLFPAPEGGLLNANNFASRDWRPAVDAAGVRLPARLYDLRSTFASNALAAGLGTFELARVMGTSVAMIERHYGTLLDGAGAGIASRLAAFESEQDRATDWATDEGS